MNKRLKSAIIGYGYMGEIRHNVIKNISNLELKIICDSNKSKIPANENYLITNNFNVVVNSDVDIVFVCTPNNLTPKIVIECLKKNKHVFCEKPPGKNLKDLNKIKRYLKPNLKLMFGFNHRFHPAVIKAKEIIKSKNLGKIITLRGVYGKSGGVNFKNSWRNNKKISGGGILLDQGIHMIDLFRFFCGNFNQIKCYSSNLFWKFQVEDNAFLILKNKNKQLAFLHSSSTLWRHTFRIDIALDKGYILIEGLLSKTGSYGQEKITYASRQFENVSKALGNPSEKVIYFDKDNSWTLEVLKFIDFIKNNKKVNINNFNDASEAMKIIKVSYKSDK
tara:strand:+ start:1582 stop:2583 length:1002 start_codon:yes stop_codon:yes gene_type:complete